jgi:cytochrome c oxidase assembly protein subunit 15
LGVLASVLGNGVVGGIAVRGDLHPFLVQSHFLLAMVSIGFGVVAIRRARPEQVTSRTGIGVTPLISRLVLLLGALVVGALATGTVVTGAGPHAGDETARRYGFDISTVAEIHSVTVWVAVAVFLALVVALRREPPLSHAFSRHVSTWMFVAVVQGGIGYLQYFNDVPAVLVAAHVAGATALWVVTVQFVQAVLEPLSHDGCEVGEHKVHAPETRDERPFSFGAAPTA